MAVDEKTRTGLVTRMMRRLEGRERMKRLLAEAPESKARPELVRLRDYLLRWASYERAYRENLGAGSAQPLAHQPSSATSAMEFYERSDRWAMMQVEAGMGDLAAIPGGMSMRSAVRVRYLNEGVSRDAGRTIRVFRSGRLEPISMMEADRLADMAEEALIPILRKRDLPL